MVGRQSKFKYATWPIGVSFLFVYMLSSIQKRSERIQANVLLAGCPNGIQNLGQVKCEAKFASNIGLFD